MDTDWELQQWRISRTESALGSREHALAREGEGHASSRGNEGKGVWVKEEYTMHILILNCPPKWIRICA